MSLLDKRDEEFSRVIAVRVPPGMAAAVEKVAAAEFTSLSNLARRALADDRRRRRPLGPAYYGSSGSGLSRRCPRSPATTGRPAHSLDEVTSPRSRTSRWDLRLNRTRAHMTDETYNLPKPRHNGGRWI